MLDQSERNDLAKRIEEASDRVRSGESESETLELPSGGALRFIRDSDSSGGFRVETEVEGTTLTSRPFPPSATRPADYPESLPFLANTPANLNELPGAKPRTVAWMQLDDPAGQLSGLRDQLLAAGWGEKSTREEELPHGSRLTIEFEQGGFERSLILSRSGEHSQLMLFEGAHDPDEE